MGTWYSPAESVWVVDDWLVARFLTETVALGTAFPDASAIVPESVARSFCVCACREAANRIKSDRIIVSRGNLSLLEFMCDPPDGHRRPGKIYNRSDAALDHQGCIRHWHKKEIIFSIRAIPDYSGAPSRDLCPAAGGWH